MAGPTPPSPPLSGPQPDGWNSGLTGITPTQAQGLWHNGNLDGGNLILETSQSASLLQLRYPHHIYSHGPGGGAGYGYYDALFMAKVKIEGSSVKIKLDLGAFRKNGADKDYHFPDWVSNSGIRVNDGVYEAIDYFTGGTATHPDARNAGVREFEKIGNGWQIIHFPIHFTTHNIPADARLGISVQEGKLEIEKFELLRIDRGGDVNGAPTFDFDIRWNDKAGSFEAACRDKVDYACTDSRHPWL